VHITEETLKEKMAEMINAAGELSTPILQPALVFNLLTVYFTGATQHPPHQVKFDF
jgi:hypothetical protein